MSIVNICDYTNCTGCGACLNVCPKRCIEMKQTDEGFLYPSVNSNMCIECGLCKITCPDNNSLFFNSPLDTYAGFSIDDAIRESSSSGGLFTVLATEVLRHGGVVYGAAFDESLKLAHRKAETLEELSRLKGSKYLQSSIVDIYSEINSFINNKRVVLFVGTPCQVAGIKSYIKKNKTCLITIDVVCHGVPSPLAFYSYINKLTNYNSNDSHLSFVFRDLSHWGYSPSLIIDGKEEKLKDERNVYIDFFLRGELSRESCYSCKYARNERISDITLADFWGIGTEQPYRNDTSKGVNLILVNTELGKQLLDSVKSEINIEPRSFSEASKNNSQLNAPLKRPVNRDNIYKLFLSSSLYDLDSMNRSSLWRLKRYVKKLIRR